MEELEKVQRWSHDCWHCAPGRHPKPVDVIEREERARAERPKMPDEVKAVLRERTKAKAQERKAKNAELRTMKQQDRTLQGKKSRGVKAGESLEQRYGPLRAVAKITGHTGGGCPQVVLSCGHSKTVHHDKVKEVRCVRCKPGRAK